MAVRLEVAPPAERQVVLELNPANARPQPFLQINSVAGRIALGVAAGVISFSVGGIAAGVAAYLMKLYGMPCIEGQDAMVEWESIDTLLSGTDATAAKVHFFVETVIVAPIIEEFLFRGILQNVTRWVQGSDSTAARVMRVFFNALVFAACHLSPEQGYSNVPVFVATFIAGVIYATVREATGSLVSSTAAHMVDNGITMATLVLRI